MVLTVMHDWPLEPGQMLLFGPAAVKMLQSGEYAPPLPDVFVFDRREWAVYT